jgi:hypothetical protein
MFFSDNNYRKFNDSIVQEGANLDLEYDLEDEVALMEAVLMNALSSEELEAFLESADEVNDAIEGEVLLERSIVKLDKFAKLSRAKRIAIYNIARRKKDPKMKKLVTLWKMEARIQKYLIKKYGNEAGKEAKHMVNKKSISNSKSVKKAAEKAKAMFNKEVPVKGRKAI